MLMRTIQIANIDPFVLTQTSFLDYSTPRHLKELAPALVSLGLPDSSSS